MARQINSGALPFALTVDSYSTVSPSLGENSLSAMVLAGLIAFALIVVFMTMLYRLPGFLASCGFDEYMVYLHRVPHPHSIY